MIPVRPAALLVLALAAAGCITVGGGGGKPLEQRSFDLQPPLPPATPPEAEGPEVVWVEPFTSDPALDREEIVWRRGSVESGAWDRYRWVRPPAEAARAVIADSLGRSGACAVAASEPRVANPDYSLRAHVARFEEVDGEGSWSGCVEVRAALVRTLDGQEILRRTYARSQVAAARNPGEVVEAIRKALDGVAADLVEDVRKALRRDRGHPAEAPPAGTPRAESPPPAPAAPTSASDAPEPAGEDSLPR